VRFLTRAIFTLALVAISAFSLVRGDYQGKKTPVAEEPQRRPLALHPLKRNTNDMTSSHVASAAMVRLPLTFEANHGQKDPRVKFMAHGLGYELFLTSDGLTLSARHNVLTGFSPAATRKPDVVQLNFVGANRKSSLSGVEELPGKVDYFLGKPDQWHLDVPTYRKVRYSGVYPGVGLTYYDRGGNLESDFLIAPRHTPREISFAISGATPRLSPSGDLLLRTQSGSLFELQKPTAYQMIGAAKKNVEVVYSISSSQWSTCCIRRS
jgi:hypothetical protein